LKKLLLVAIALVAAGSIAFAISAFTNSVPSPDSLADAADDNDKDSRGANDCLEGFWVVTCLLAPEEGYCCVSFGIKHLEQSDPCCNHAPPIPSAGPCISINHGVWLPMTLLDVELGEPCDLTRYISTPFVLKEGEEADVEIDCPGHASCYYATEITPYCDE